MAINKFIVLVSVLFLSLTANADDVPNTFQAGEPIVASDVNENFTDLQNQINVLKAQLYSQNSTETPREFVGITASSTTGNIGGYFNANQMCNEAHPGSVMCTSDEIRNADPALIGEPVWIDPVIINATGNSQQGFIYSYEFGYYSYKHTNCGDWSKAGSNDTGTFIEEGSRSFVSCTSSYKIACCK